MPTLDLALARRLNRPGPRYTSYPTAPHFTGAFNAATYDAALDTLRADRARPLSLYLHIPFCSKLCHYCGCFTKITQRRETVERYLGYLLREIDLVAERVTDGAPREVVQIHLGGGTPTMLGADGLTRLMAHLRRRFAVRLNAEIALEADPRTLTPALLDAMAAARFTRMSLGVQSFDPAVQRAIGRVQPYADVVRAVRGAREHGIRNLSFDLIYGLPHQSVTSFARTLDLAVTLDPDRLSVFGYAHVPWMKKHQRLIDEAVLPTPEDRLRLYALAMSVLGARRYRHIGMDHFARPASDLARAQDAGTMQRNFQGYSTHAGAALLGFGVSAIGGFDATTPEGMRSVYAQNAKGLPAYYHALDAGRLPIERGRGLTHEDHLRRYVIERLLCDFELDLGDVAARYGLRDARTHLADALAQLTDLEALGVVLLEPGGVLVTERGRPFVRNVAMAFDAYLPAPSTPVEAEAQRYSQTV